MKRKRIKKTTNQVIAGTLAASFLTVSCTQYNLPEHIVNDNVNVTNPEIDLGKIAIPISLQLKPDDAQYILAIQRLTNDILVNPQVAKELSLNPEAVLRQYGFDGAVNLDDGLLKIVKALSDVDLLNAIKANDFRTFVDISMEKGLFKSTESVFSISYYEQQLNSLLQHKDIERFLEESKMLRSGVVYDAFVLWGLVYIAVALYMAAIVATVGFLTAAYAAVSFGTFYNVGSSSISEGDLSTIDFFILNSDARDAFIVVDKEIEEITNKTIDIVRTVQPNYFDTVSEIEARNLIKINLVNHLN